MSSKLSFILEALSFLALLIPLCGLLWIATKNVTGKNGLRSFIFAAAAVIVLVFILPPHEDIFTGLDNSAYRLMAETFTEGRPIVGTDTSAEIVPENLRLNLRYRPLSNLRATRDIVFQTGQMPEDTGTRPFFMPFLSMAAAGSGIINRFPILLGAVWFTLLFIAVKTKQKTPAALAVCAALILATPFPLWFCRGYFADAAAAFIACIPLLTSNRKSIANSICSGFLLGLSVTIHPISVLIAAPIFIYLVLSSSRIQHGIATVLSAVAGFLPLVFITRYICQPYGDWTRFSNIRQIFSATGEHAALASGAILLILFALVSICAAYNRETRSALSHFAAKIPATLWSLAAILPIALACFIPGDAGAAIKKGFLGFANGFGLSGIFAVCLIFVFVFRANGNNTLKMLLTLICWTAIPFALIKGIEVQAGIWSFRRLAPTAIAIMSVGALAYCPGCLEKIPGISAVFSQNSSKTIGFGSVIKIGTLIVLIALSLFNVIRSPRSYLGVNDAGASRFRADLQTKFSDADIIFFDYHPHSTPFACKLSKPVFGLGKFATAEWPAVEKWLAGTASTGKTVIATSYLPCQMEDGVILLPHNNLITCEANFSAPKSPAFMPAQKVNNKFTVTLLDVIPLSSAEVTNHVQRKILDGGPIGIRGNWFQKSGKEGMWSRQNCGIIGPVHKGEIKMTIDAQWFPPSDDWKTQALTITPPWADGNPQTIELNADRNTYTVTFECAVANAFTGNYTITAEKPYSPATFGQKGYPEDLGALFYSVKIE